MCVVHGSLKRLRPERGDALSLARRGLSPVSTLSRTPAGRGDGGGRQQTAAGEGPRLSKMRGNLSSDCRKRLVAFAHRCAWLQAGWGASGVTSWVQERKKADVGPFIIPFSLQPSRRFPPFHGQEHACACRACPLRFRSTRVRRTQQNQPRLSSACGKAWTSEK